MTDTEKFQLIELTHRFDNQFHQKTFAVANESRIYNQYLTAVVWQKDNIFKPEPSRVAQILEENECVYYGTNGKILMDENGVVLREYDYDTEGKGECVAYRQYHQNGALELVQYYANYEGDTAFHVVQPNTIRVTFDEDYKGLKEITFKRTKSDKAHEDFKITSAHMLDRTLTKDTLAHINKYLNVNHDMLQIIEDVRKTNAAALEPKHIDIRAYKNA
jgi:hypothetical protein